MRKKSINCVEDVLEHFPEGIPKQFYGESEDHAPVYFFSNDSCKNMKTCICNKCGEEIELANAVHMIQARCPACGADGEVVELFRYSTQKDIMKNLTSECMTYHFGRSIINPDYITCTAIHNIWEYFKSDPMNPIAHKVIEAMYVFIPGEGGYLAGRKTKLWISFFMAFGAGKFKLFKSCRARHNLYQNSYMRVAIGSPNNLGNIAQGTSLNYAYDVYKEKLHPLVIVEVLDDIAKYPLSMEHLGKVGMTDVILRAIESGIGLNSMFNMNACKLNKMTKGKISQKDMGLLSGQNILVIQLYQWLKQQANGKTTTVEDIINNSLGMYHKGTIQEILPYVEIKKVLKYLNKQQAHYSTIRITLDMYRDYINDRLLLGMPVNSKSDLFPKDLHRLHMNLQTQVRVKDIELKQAKYEERYAKLVNMYSFKNDDYMIVVPAELKDLTREGSDMSNCVGTYIDRVANGQCDVVYIRKVSEPDKSFGTMEIRSGRIIQARAKHNGRLPEDAQAFVELFRIKQLEKGKKAT